MRPVPAGDGGDQPIQNHGARQGCYAFIANGDGAHREMGHGGGPCMLHNPSYDFNDDLIPLGAALGVRLAQRWLSRPPNDRSHAGFQQQLR